jgi:hypothetical protein
MSDGKGGNNMEKYTKKVFQFEQIVDENYINKKYVNEIDMYKVFFIDKRNTRILSSLSSYLHDIEGLHKIYYKNELKYQYIVFNGDLYSLIYSLSGLFNHGSQDGLYIKENLKEMTILNRSRKKRKGRSNTPSAEVSGTDLRFGIAPTGSCGRKEPTRTASSKVLGLGIPRTGSCTRKEPTRTARERDLGFSIRRTARRMLTGIAAVGTKAQAPIATVRR